MAHMLFVAGTVIMALGAIPWIVAFIHVLLLWNHMATHHPEVCKYWQRFWLLKRGQREKFRNMPVSMKELGDEKATKMNHRILMGLIYGGIGLAVGFALIVLSIEIEALAK